MTCLIAGSVRVGIVILVGTLLIAGMSRDAVARTARRHLHARGFRCESRERRSVKREQLVPQQPVRPGAMRYYGGPKSPMWRGPVGN